MDTSSTRPVSAVGWRRGTEFEGLGAREVSPLCPYRCDEHLRRTPRGVRGSFGSPRTCGGRFVINFFHVFIPIINIIIIIRPNSSYQLHVTALGRSGGSPASTPPASRAAPRACAPCAPPAGAAFRTSMPQKWAAVAKSRGRGARGDELLVVERLRRALAEHLAQRPSSGAWRRP